MKFIRVNGRVIPIREAGPNTPNKTESRANVAAKTLYAAGGATLGATAIAARHLQSTGRLAQNIAKIRTAGQVGLGLAVGGVAAALVRDTSVKNRMDAHGAGYGERLKTSLKYTSGDTLALAGGLFGPGLLAGGLAKGLRATAKGVKSEGFQKFKGNVGDTARSAYTKYQNFGRNGVVKTPHTGPMKDVFTSVKRITGK